MKTNKLLQAAIAGSFLALSVAPAQAITFDYGGYGGFVQGTNVGFPAFGVVAGTNNTNAGANVYRQVNWGTGQPPDNLPSGAEVNQLGLAGVANPVILGGTNYGQGLSGTVPTDGTSANLGWLTHINHVINEAFTGDVTIRYDLVLYDGATFVHEEERLFTLTFTETPNSPPCVPADGTTCPDTFTYVAAGSPNFNFSYGGVDYLGAFGPFVNANAAGQYVSPEVDPGLNNTYATFNITTVPEPGTVALMGIGLGFLAWRRRQSGQA